MSFHRSSALLKEIHSWVEEGLVDQAQAEKLIARYDLEGELPWFRQTPNILKGVAFLFLGMSFLLLISANWDQLPIAVRSAVGFLPLLAAYVAGGFYQIRKQPERAEKAFFLATLLLGGNIALQAQIFHFSSYFPNGLKWWLIGSLPVIVIYRSQFTAWSMHLILVIWLGMQQQFEQFSLVTLLVIGVLAWLEYQKPTRVGAVLLAISGFMTVLQLAGAWEGFEEVIFHPNAFLLLVAGYALAFQALLLQTGFYPAGFTQRWQTLWSWLFLLLIFVLSFHEITEENLRESHFSFTALGLLVIGLVLSWQQLRQSLNELHLLILLGVVAFAMFGATSFLTLSSATTMGIVLLANALILGAALGLLYLGIQFQSKAWFFRGVWWLLILAFSRYLEYVDSYILTALGMGAAALLLYSLNKLWQKRFA